MSDVLADWRSLAAAADAAAATAQPPVTGDLWGRGQRNHRRQRRGTLLILTMATALLLAVGTWGWQSSVPVQPADRPAGEVGLPDRIYPVPKWLPVGPLGSPALAVTTVQQGTLLGTEERIAAISATSGDYAILDLPDLAKGSDGVALSPDGRYLAYWTAGTPSGDPNTSGGQADTITGVTVRDLTSGEVLTHHEIATVHGVSPSALLWADSDALVFGYWQWLAGENGDEMESSSTRDHTVLHWPLDGTPDRLSLPGADGIDDFTEAQDSVLVTSRRLLDLKRMTSRRVSLPSGVANIGPAGGSIDLRADGTHVVIGGPGLPSKVPNRVSLTTISPSGSTTKPRVVPGTAGTIQVLGWRGDQLVVTRWLRGERAEVQAVDVDTGEREALTRTPRFGWSAEWQWAEDLLDADIVAGQKPPAPANPRALVIWTAAISIVASAALVVWRRRVRA